MKSLCTALSVLLSAVLGCGSGGGGNDGRGPSGNSVATAAGDGGPGREGGSNPGPEAQVVVDGPSRDLALPQEANLGDALVDALVADVRTADVAAPGVDVAADRSITSDGAIAADGPGAPADGPSMTSDATAAAGTRPRRGGSLATGGTVMSSGRYRAVVTLGQAPGGNAVSTSAKYRFRGGIVGATQGR